MDMMQPSSSGTTQSQSQTRSFRADNQTNCLEYYQLVLSTVHLAMLLIKVGVFLTVMSAGQPCGFQGYHDLPLKFPEEMTIVHDI